MWKYNPSKSVCFILLKVTLRMAILLVIHRHLAFLSLELEYAAFGLYPDRKQVEISVYSEGFTLLL